MFMMLVCDQYAMILVCDQYVYDILLCDGGGGEIVPDYRLKDTDGGYRLKDTDGSYRLKDTEGVYITHAMLICLFMIC